MAQLTIDAVVKAYVSLRDRKNEIKKRHSEELSPITQKMEKIEGWLLRDLQTRKVKSQKTDEGTAFVTSVTKATVKDRDALFEFAIQNEMWDLFESRVSKSVVQDYLEQTGEIVPGVDYTETKAVRIRR